MLLLCEVWTLCTVGPRMKKKWQIVDKFFFMIEFKVFFFNNFQIYLNNIGWIRIRMDPELGNSKLDPDPE